MEESHETELKSIAPRRQEQPAEDTLCPEDQITIPIRILTRGMKPSVVKRRSVITFICVPVFFFLLVSALCAFQIYLSNSPVTKEFVEIKEILLNVITTSCDRSPINSVLIVNKSESCPSNYNQSAFGSWPGSHQGCFDSRTGLIRSGACNQDKKEYEFPLPVVPPRNMTIWKDTQLCLKSISNATYSMQTNCSLGYKSCKHSPGFICIPSQEACPISSIGVFTLDTLSEKDPNFTYVHIINSTYLVYANNDAASRSLMGFRTSLNHVPCLNPQRSSVRFESEGYPILNIKEEGCGNYGENSDTSIIDSYSEYKYYSENEMNEELDALPNLKALASKEKVVLVAEFANEMQSGNPVCSLCMEPQYSEIKRIDRELGQWTSYYRIYSKIGLLLIGIMISASLFNSYQFFFKKERLETYYRRLGQSNIIVFVIMLAHFFNASMISIFSALEIKKTVDSLHDFTEANCFKNQNLNRVMTDLHKDFFRANFIVMVDSCVILAASLIATLAFLIAVYLLYDIINKEAKRSKLNSIQTTAAVTQNETQGDEGKIIASE